MGSITVGIQHYEPEDDKGHGNDKRAAESRFDDLLQEKRCDAGGNRSDHYRCQCAPVVCKHSYPVLVKTEQQSHKRAPVKRYIKSQCVYLTFPSEHKWKQYK